MIGGYFIVKGIYFYPYWICVDFGFAAGLGVIFLCRRYCGFKIGDLLSLTLLSFVLGVGGARILALIEARKEFSINQLINGNVGLTFYGGVIFVFIGIISYLKIRNIPFLNSLDVLSLALVVGYGIGRIGCFLSGDGCYGIASNLPWAMSFPHGTVPVFFRVHPTPLYESLVSFLIFFYYYIRFKKGNNKKYKGGVLFSHIIMLMAYSRFFVEFIRLNEHYGGLSLAQWISLIIIIIITTYKYITLRRYANMQFMFPINQKTPM